jgi:hypothetical protein
LVLPITATHLFYRALRFSRISTEKLLASAGIERTDTVCAIPTQVLLEMYDLDALTYQSGHDFLD